MIKEDTLVSGVKFLLTLVFLHRCIMIYERWNLGRTEKFHTSQAMTGTEPFPSLTFRRYLVGQGMSANKSINDEGRNLRSFLGSAKFNNGSHFM